MKELLECKDLLANERVVAAYVGLGCDQGFDIWGVKTKPTLSSLADVAFAMRDAICKTEQGAVEWLTKLDDMHKGNWLWSKQMMSTTAEHWIIAATLAWEATQ